MEYGKIIAVTGLTGLFELLNSKNDGAIVRSLDDKTTKFVSSRVHNFSHLESIEVFTVRDNVNLIEIFNAMDKDGGKVPDGKDGKALKQYFEKIYGDLDFERVYTSDLKKMVKWYEVLKVNNIEIKLTEKPEDELMEEEQPEEDNQIEKKKASSPKSSSADAKTGTSEKKSESTETATGKPVAKKKAEPKDTSNSPKAAAAKEEVPASSSETSKEIKNAAPKKSASAKPATDKAVPKKKS